MRAIASRIAPGIAREVQSHRGIREHFGLLERKEAVDRHAAIGEVAQGVSICIADSVGQGQVGPKLELILNVGIHLVGTGIDEAAAGLRVGARQSQQEVGSGIARAQWVGRGENEAPVVAAEEGVADLKTTAFKSHLQSVLADDFGKVVGELIGLVDARLRAIAGKAEVEEPVDRDSRNAGHRRILRIDLEAERGRQHDVLRLHGDRSSNRV